MNLLETTSIRHRSYGRSRHLARGAVSPLVIACLALQALPFSASATDRIQAQIPIGVIQARDEAQCEQLDEQWRDLAERVREEHAVCIGDPGGFPPSSGDCSKARCQDLHRSMHRFGSSGDLRMTWNVQLAACRSDVARLRSALVPNDANTQGPKFRSGQPASNCGEPYEIRIHSVAVCGWSKRSSTPRGGTAVCYRGAGCPCEPATCDPY
jgi:hypothetical protein